MTTKKKDKSKSKVTRGKEPKVPEKPSEDTKQEDTPEKESESKEEPKEESTESTEKEDVEDNDGKPPVPIEVFCKLSGKKPDQIAGFRIYAKRNSLKPMSIPKWKEKLIEFQQKPMR